MCRAVPCQSSIEAFCKHIGSPRKGEHSMGALEACVFGILYFVGSMILLKFPILKNSNGAAQVDYLKNHYHDVLIQNILLLNISMPKFVARCCKVIIRCCVQPVLDILS